jgi:SSS family solute:Na+ symporter
VAVAWTDFIQMIVLVVGLSVIAVFAGRPGRRRRQGGRLCTQQGPVQVLARAHLHRHGVLLRRGLTMMLGSIPQQDVFQRVMSATASTPRRAGR